MKVEPKVFVAQRTSGPLKVPAVTMATATCTAREMTDQDFHQHVWRLEIAPTALDQLTTE